MAAILRNSPVATEFPRNFPPLSHRIPSKIRFLPLQHRKFPSNSSAGVGFGDVGRLSLGFGEKGFCCWSLRAAPGGGSTGGGGGGDGGGGGGSSGAGGDGDGGNDSFFLSWYLMALDKQPVMTKSITSALLTLIGDLICQLLIDQVPQLDLNRTFVFTLLGLVLVGPTLHYWYLSLSKMITMPGASGAFLRLLLDQFGFAPIFIGVFLSALVTLEGRPSQVMPKLKQEWFSSVVANWQLWIPFQFLNFLFVPQKFQVLAANFVALAWNVILSFKAHRAVVLK
ncbi:protein sym-1 [Iris pallida]|uniref:Protein sym-1 n=1 Tax=Iris pallida TaxID=29817 RepID=A0AAX6EKR5_IRIPA|nr:protein sym-1 [Iris pallida]